MQILVTGGAGFIGANFVRAALDAHHELAVLDNFSQGSAGYLADLPIRIVQGDILNAAVVGEEVQGHHVVVHLAAQTGVPGSLADPYRDCQINVLGTLNVLEACRHATPRPRLVFASSNAPLGRQAPPATEDKVPLPVSPYGASKLAAEAYCLAYHSSWGVETVILRFGNVYGPFSAHKASVIAQFLKDIREHGTVTIDGNGQQTRDFIYVGDLCRAMLLACSSNVSGEIFQIATGIETTIGELAEAFSSVLRVPLATQHGPARAGDIERNYSGIAKARKLLDWQPEVSLSEGLQKTRDWYAVWREASAGSRT
jgi:UDP-glucose 4-epimerase